MATVTIGKLDKRVKFETCDLVNLNPVTGGGNVEVWGDLLTTWGSLKKSNGNRALDYGEIVENNTYTLYTYYQTALFNALHNDAVAKVRIIIDDSRKFTIVTWEKVGEKTMFLKFTLNEQR